MRLVLILSYLQIKTLRFRQVNILAQGHTTEQEFEPYQIPTSTSFLLFTISHWISRGKNQAYDEVRSDNDQVPWFSPRTTEWDGSSTSGGWLVATDHPPASSLYQSAHDLQQIPSLSEPWFPYLWGKSKRIGSLLTPQLDDIHWVGTYWVWSKNCSKSSWLSSWMVTSPSLPSTNRQEQVSLSLA